MIHVNRISITVQNKLAYNAFKQLVFITQLIDNTESPVTISVTTKFTLNFIKCTTCDSLHVHLLMHTWEHTEKNAYIQNLEVTMYFFILRFIYNLL